MELSSEYVNATNADSECSGGTLDMAAVRDPTALCAHVHRGGWHSVLGV